jgi:transcriptional regulator with XRE-family HTH domain
MNIKRIRSNVAILRTLNGWEQQDLAQRAGVSRSYISRLESGETQNPRIDELSRVAAALGKSIDELSREIDIVFRTDEPAKTVADGPRAYSAETVPVPIVPRDAWRVEFAGTGDANPFIGFPLQDDEQEGAVFVLCVNGDCLTPDIEPGDWLLASANQSPQVGDVISVIYGGERYIKRVRERNGVWVLESRHGILRVPADEVHVEGVVKRILTEKSLPGRR